jgi:glycosyltransferase involved in cell wall biosynthesis
VKVEALSALVTTRNESAMIAECLASCSFADEVVVVDSGSDDDTCRIAEELGARVIVHPFAGHAAQKNWGLEQLAHDWVLVLDADERVTAPLRDEITTLLREGPSRRGYRIRRRNTFLGREIRGCGWQRDRVLRLFDRRAGRYAPRRVHEEVRLAEEPGSLRHALLHHSCRDLATWLDKVNRYAALGAEELAARGRRPHRRDLVLRPPARFVKQWLLQGGFRDGAEGLILCALSAYGVFAKYARLHDVPREGR